MKRAHPQRPLIMREASPADLPAVMALLDEAHDWLHTQGIHDQWDKRFNPEDMLDRIIDGEVYLTRRGAIPVGTLTLDYRPDPEFWGSPSDKAGYVHRLAVARSAAGSGVGSFMLNQAAERLLEAGRDQLRLDCAKNNSRLHRYYTQLGFHHVRTVDLPHRASGALFERLTSRRIESMARASADSPDHQSPTL